MTGGSANAADYVPALGSVYVLTPAEFERWLSDRRGSPRCVYAQGTQLPHGNPTVLAVAEAVRVGAVTTHQVVAAEAVVAGRAASRWWHFIAARRAAAAESAPPPASVNRAVTDHALDIFARRVARGDVAPTNAELADLLGLKNADAARYVVGQLLRRGVIRITDHGPRQRRIVTISATGQSTAPGRL